MRLDKYIANSGIATRSEVKKLLRSGVVTVDGETVKKGELQIDEKNSRVMVNGKDINYREFVYLMLNKPPGYVSATEDKHYKTVIDLVGEEYTHFNVFPVGRLDIDTEGFLILSNDGAFAHNLTGPKKNVYKKYFAVLEKPAKEQDIDAFKAGMEFKDFTAKSALLEITDNPKEVYVSIAEGKFHQVKRMFERVDNKVEYLKRVSIGELKLDESLPQGKIRELTSEEINMLFK